MMSHGNLVGGSPPCSVFVTFLSKGGYLTVSLASVDFSFVYCDMSFRVEQPST